MVGRMRFSLSLPGAIVVAWMIGGPPTRAAPQTPWNQCVREQAAYLDDTVTPADVVAEAVWLKCYRFFEARNTLDHSNPYWSIVQKNLEILESMSKTNVIIPEILNHRAAQRRP